MNSDRISALPYFSLSWVLTLLSHDLDSLSTIARLFDVLLAENPVFVVYLGVSVGLSAQYAKLAHYIVDDRSEERGTSNIRSGYSRRSFNPAPHLVKTTYNASSITFFLFAASPVFITNAIRLRYRNHPFLPLSIFTVRIRTKVTSF